jgi:hypothetical protein
MTLFTEKAPRLMLRLMEDFGLTEIEAAAVLGNAGHESAGFTKLQEMRPTVKGSRGGYGYFQWTGPRRREYEAYCKRNGYDPASEEANYKFLYLELITTEKAAIPALKAAKTLDTKVKAFERAYERAGVKHYPSRILWAEKALAAFKARDTSAVLEPPVFIPPPPDIEPIPEPAAPAPEAGFSWAVVVGILVALGIIGAIAAKIYLL